MNDTMKLYGSERSLPALKNIRAGCIDMILENGAIRYLSVEGTEIIRMIYSAVRIQGWLTVEPEIVKEEFVNLPGGFEAKIKCRYLQGETHFEADYTITGNVDNTVVFIMDGIARSTFKRCRIGFCVLHPLIHVKGTKCVIIHSDGKKEISSFPEYISPHHPFTDIRGLEWEIEGLGRVSLDFKGEIFETEDHRNWTDASFKTFCTPLNLPYPVEVKEGTTVKQSVAFKFIPARPSFNILKQNNITIQTEPAKILKLPSLGISKSTRGKILTSNEIKILKQAGFNHYRIDVYTFDQDWEKELEESLRQSMNLGMKCEIAIFFTGNYVTDNAVKIVNLLKGCNASVERIIILHRTEFSVPEYLWTSASAVFRTKLSEIKLVAGTNANFFQINNSRPQFDSFDELVFSIHPQEHAFDNLSLVENIAAQFDVVESARQFSHCKPIIISPVTIQRRFNANKENYEQPVEGDDMPWQVDKRILSLFGAVWTCGSFLYLSKAGAGSVTYYETAGERGIIQGDYPSRWPDKFPAHAKLIFPVYHILRKLNSWRNQGYEMILTTSSNPLAAEAILLQNSNSRAGIIFNYSVNEQTVEINIGQKNVYIKSINLSNYDLASHFEDFLENFEQLVESHNSIFKFTLRPEEIILFEGQKR